MKKNKMYYRIKDLIEKKRGDKKFYMGEIIVYTILIGFIALALGAASNFFDDGTFLTPKIYKWYFVICIAVIVIIITYIGLYRTIAKESEIQKKGEDLLEEFTSFEESGCEDFTLFEEIRVESRTDVLWAISDLKEMLEKEQSSPSYVIDTQKKLYMDIYMIILREKVRWKYLVRKIFLSLYSIWVVAKCIHIYLVGQNVISWSYWYFGIEVVLLVILALYTFTLGFDVSEQEVIERAKKIYKKYNEIGGNDNGKAYGYKTYHPEHLESVMRGLRELLNYWSKNHRWWRTSYWLVFN